MSKSGDTMGEYTCTQLVISKTNKVYLSCKTYLCACLFILKTFADLIFLVNTFYVLGYCIKI